jgi:hypothetical protein
MQASMKLISLSWMNPFLHAHFPKLSNSEFSALQDVHELSLEHDKQSEEHIEQVP